MPTLKNEQKKPQDFVKIHILCMNTENLQKMVFSKDHPKTHATIAKEQNMYICWFLYPYKIFVCDKYTLNVYILMTLEEADCYWH